MLEFPI